ncbi:acyl transferase [Sphingobacterium sp. UT-1RO-CII-1]|uniref:acyl transferase n=1 Tax=Sphingobacterium sp. UT-1RO-CII-1 TaxID=2995225 RepID=UPI00227C7AF2|nr:acyl transferase [Sphingobacterium sp. UT-1RO-CII-1]MCY4778881.1 acyl transferase [Sphingobacterium sp. UT-1RO-CII-1]
MFEHIFSIDNEKTFNNVCLEVFDIQKNDCAVYAKYLSALDQKHSHPKHYTEIPFLPIQFFKSQDVVSSSQNAQITFTSSGTTGMLNSKHIVTDLAYYEKSFRKCFYEFYGDATDIAILALLPNYLEREGSSLIYMIDDLIKQSNHIESGYFLYNHEDLYQRLINLKSKGTRTLLIGVTYALLDFCENYTVDFPELIVMETGGMKGKRKELIREELHTILCDAFSVTTIHSEYGMTELLSQAYSYGKGLFKTPNWMKALCRDTNDPLSLVPFGRTGALNIIDLANFNSCSFIATDDLAKNYENGTFEVIGRFDQSEIRGCNLLVQ